MQVPIISSLLVLIMSVVIHEVSHGYVANALGDPTARLEGRLTLNPIKHLDWFGSIVFPILTYTLGGLIFGWAKPVPYNPYNLRNRRWGELMVAIAGPASNFILALVFGTILRFSDLLGLTSSFQEIIALITFINILLGIFNLVPIPPLDGSKVLFDLLPQRFLYIRKFLEQNQILIVLVFIFFLWQFVTPLVSIVFQMITGVQLL